MYQYQYARKWQLNLYGINNTSFTNHQFLETNHFGSWYIYSIQHNMSTLAIKIHGFPCSVYEVNRLKRKCSQFTYLRCQYTVNALKDKTKQNANLEAPLVGRINAHWIANGQELSAMVHHEVGWLCWEGYWLCHWLLLVVPLVVVFQGLYLEKVK